MPLYSYFLITLAVELPVVILFFRQEWKRALATGFLLNLFTWPLLHILLFETRININLLEVAVTVVEATGYFLLMRCTWWKAIAVSLIANGMSYGIGILINN